MHYISNILTLARQDFLECLKGHFPLTNIATLAFIRLKWLLDLVCEFEFHSVATKPWDLHAWCISRKKDILIIALGTGLLWDGGHKMSFACLQGLALSVRLAISRNSKFMAVVPLSNTRQSRYLTHCVSVCLSLRGRIQVSKGTLRVNKGPITQTRVNHIFTNRYVNVFII